MTDKNLEIRARCSDLEFVKFILKKNKALLQGIRLLTPSLETPKSKKIFNFRRETYILHNLEFHLDKVKGLGNFIEIIPNNLNNHYTKKIKDELDKYLTLFEITSENLIEEDYRVLYRKFIRK